MANSPFCFVHATNTRLDQPLWGIGAVSGEARRLAEEATNLAFQHVVETCIEHGAAFLLLTGNTFDAAHPHRARMLLEQACERLAEHDCDVFLIPGQSDPAAAYAHGTHLPHNTAVFLGHSDSESVIRDGVTLATIEPFRDRQNVMSTAGSNGLRIGLVAGNEHLELQQQLAGDDNASLEIKHLERYPSLINFGYLALGNGSQRITVQLPQGLAHDPGCPQPLDGRQTSAHGCTLVEVDPAGELQTRLIPTSIVRREEIELELTADMDWDDVAAGMQAALVERDPLPSEQLWLVRWVFDGAGATMASLMEPSAQQELTELVEAELDDDRDLLRIHDVEIRARWSDALDISEAGSVFEEFSTLIEEHAAEHLTQFRRGLPARDWPEAGWVRYVIDSADQATTKRVTLHGQHLARRHLLNVTAAELGSRTE